MEKISTKNDVVAKTCGVNNKSRMFTNNHVTIFLRELDFFRATSTVDVAAAANEKMHRSSLHEMGMKFHGTIRL